MNKTMLMLLALLLSATANAGQDETDPYAEADIACTAQASEQADDDYDAVYTRCMQSRGMLADEDTHEPEPPPPESIDDSIDLQDPTDSPAFTTADTACDDEAQNQTEQDYWQHYHDCMARRGFSSTNE